MHTKVFELPGGWDEICARVQYDIQVDNYISGELFMILLVFDIGSYCDAKAIAQVQNCTNCKLECSIKTRPTNTIKVRYILIFVNKYSLWTLLIFLLNFITMFRIFVSVIKHIFMLMKNICHYVKHL